MDALTTVGLVSITDIPNFDKETMFKSMQDCSPESAVTREHTFPDGTRRRTLATHTIPGGVQRMSHNSANCDSFSKTSNDFRKTVAQVTTAFATLLATILHLEDDSKPLLTTNEGDYSFESIQDVVENGEHLEHFHSYEKKTKTHEELQDHETIDIHTDQGLFIAFTPGLLIGETFTSTSQAQDSQISQGFYIELQDGSRVMVNFDEKDDLVFMLGDGVQQLINPRLTEDSPNLRPTPHALTMPTTTNDLARVWYGRMVLPPVDAIHPMHGDTTFGEIRQGIIDASSVQEANHASISLGCSADTMSVRNLQDTTCDDADTIYCWFRCMKTTDFLVSEDICSAESLDLRCINPRNQLYVAGHGDYYPACIDAANAVNVTAYPPITEIPRDNEACSASELESFVSSSTGDYENMVTMSNATFLWTVTDGMVDGRFVFNGLFGWLAFGFANVGGSKNGMSGATIIMALPGGDYDAAVGLDTTLDDSVEEYVIDLENSAFRYWQTPVSSVARVGVTTTAHAVEASDCFTAITFKTDSIHTKTFNLDGSDELIWAANAEDTFAGYHGRANRGRFAIDWTTGIATENGNPLNVEAGDSSGAAAFFFGAWTLVAGAAITVLFV